MAQLFVQLKDERYPCDITHSTRARYLRLKLTHSGKLSVVVPRGVGLRQINDFVASQALWVERSLAKLTPTNHHLNPPNHLHLAYLNETWHLDYLPSPDSTSIEINVTEPLTLECSGNVGNIELLHKALGGWLKNKADQVIPARLAELAEQHGFHFNRVTIRGQKTRWGSCSSSKNINLNYKLLFLAPALVDYVLIHELCHTIEMNHSSRFWALVADCDAAYQWHDKQLNQVASTLPI